VYVKSVLDTLFVSVVTPEFDFLKVLGNFSSGRTSTKSCGFHKMATDFEQTVNTIHYCQDIFNYVYWPERMST